MTLEEGTKGRISLVKRLEYQKGVGTPSIGLTYTPTLKVLHIPTSTLILAKNFSRKIERECPQYYPMMCVFSQRILFRVITLYWHGPHMIDG